LEAARRYVAAAAAYEHPGTAAPPAAWWSAYTSTAPWEAARDLDDWVRRHADPATDPDVDPGPAPVSGALMRYGTGGA
ncbi:hypothetical protein GUY60_19340, partial [Streptomyces sp. YC537]|nr:hypothetical protein [Streptomyces boluensis]